MRLWSESWANGDRIPQAFAAGRPDAAAIVAYSDNLNPHLAWDDVPAETRSFTLICHDFDVPTRREDVNRTDREVPSDLERADFFHWVMIDLPPTLREIAAGSFSRGFVPRGKPVPQVEVPGHGVARQGLNDYTGWFAHDPALAGRYHGYDGPFPPFNDSLVHHYVLTLYALSIDRLPVEGDFGGAQVRQAVAGRVLAVATWSGTYTLNPRLLA